MPVPTDLYRSTLDAAVPSGAPMVTAVPNSDAPPPVQPIPTATSSSPNFTMVGTGTPRVPAPSLDAGDIPTSAPPVDYSVRRTPDLLDAFNAQDKPVPYPKGTPLQYRNDHPAGELRGGENHGIPKASDVTMYDADGHITPEGRRQIESTGAKVADIPNTSPAVPHEGGPQQPAPTTQQPPQQDDLAALLKASGGGGGRYDPLKSRKSALDAAQKREDELRDMRMDAGRFNAGEIGKEANAMDRYAKEAKDRGASQTAEARGREAAFAKEAEDLAKDRINPNHYKETRGALRAGLDVLGGIFGGLATAAHGGPNPYVDHLNKVIEQDIDSQKENHRIKGEGLQAKQTAYGMMLDRFKNENVAANAAHVAELDKWKALGDARAALDKNVDAQADWAKTRDLLDEKRAEYADKAVAAAHAGGMTPEKLLALKKQILENKKLEAETRKIDAEAANPNGANAPPVVNLPGGGQAVAISKDAQEKYLTHQRGAEALEADLKTIQDIRARNKGGTLNPADVAAAQSAAARMLADYSQMNSFNRTPTDAEMKQLQEHVIPSNPAGYDPMGKTEAQLKAIQQMIEESKRGAQSSLLRGGDSLYNSATGYGQPTGPAPTTSSFKVVGQ